ncbi:MAG TPA: hypothetical protein VD962_07360 [Rubricoccaceae bacterium]|nr:hypothetical protein [Rubricoccaceae bacterium]
MRKLALLTLVLVAVGPSASAQTSFIGMGGYNIDAEGFLVGLGARFGVPFGGPALNLALQPTIETVLIGDGVTYIQGDVNVVAAFGGGGSLSPYAGAGLAIAHTSFDTDSFARGTGDASNTDIGINALVGTSFGSGSLRPFAQARATFADGSSISLMGGVMIGI